MSECSREINFNATYFDHNLDRLERYVFVSGVQKKKKKEIPLSYLSDGSSQKAEKKFLPKAAKANRRKLISSFFGWPQDGVTRMANYKNASLSKIHLIKI